MARERMVTRTITSYEVECLCMDITKAEAIVKTFPLTGDIKIEDTNKVLKALKKVHESAENPVKVVAVQNITTHEELYGMLEIDFLQIAKRLDPETRKFVEGGEE